MATRPPVKSQPLTRNKLAEFLKSHELVTAFENLLRDVSKTLPDAAENDSAAAEAAQETADAALIGAAAAQSSANAAQATASSALAQAGAAQANVDLLEAAPFVMIGTDPTAANERTLAVGPGLKLTDNGPGSTAVLDRSDLLSLLLGDVSDSTAAFVDATGLSLALEANAVYLVDGLLTFQAAATTTGLALGFTLPAGASISGLYRHNTTAVASEGSYNIAGGAVKGNTSGVLVLTENVPIEGRWLIKTAGTAGVAQLQFRSEVAASAVTLKAGLSVLIAQRIA